MTFDQRVTDIRDQLLALGAGVGGPVEEAAGRLAVAIEPALRLAALGLVSDLADAVRDQLGEIATIEVRLEAGEPVVVAVPREGEQLGDAPGDQPTEPWPQAPVVDTEPDVGVTRFTLRVPQQLKSRIDEAAVGDGVSVNAWMVRAAETALGDRARPTRRPGNRISGWIG